MLNLSRLCLAEEEKKISFLHKGVSTAMSRSNPTVGGYKVSPVAPSNSRILSRLFRVLFLF